MTPLTITRLSTAPVYAVLPAEDIHRAHRFYWEVLGLDVEMLPSGEELLVSAGDGSRILIYQRARTLAEHTVATFIVEDLRASVSELRERGVRFEDYDLPGLKTVDGIFESPTELGAWFTDSEGNTISVAQMK